VRAAVVLVDVVDDQHREVFARSGMDPRVREDDEGSQSTAKIDLNHAFVGLHFV
jgi:hypothetical protein